MGKHCSSGGYPWESPQDLIFGALFFLNVLIYITDLCNNLISNPKLFDDETLFLPVVENVNSAYINSNNDLIAKL